LAVSLPNDVDIVIAFLAAMRLGVIWVGVNRQLAGKEKASIIRDAGCVLALVDQQAAEQLTSEPADAQVVTVDRWREACDQQDNAELHVTAPDPFDPAAIAYTSGTTGEPKGVVHSQHNLMVYGATAREAGLFDSPMHAGVQLPLTILNLFVIQVLHAYQNNGKTVCMNVRTPREFAKTVQTEGIAHIATVPTIYYDLLHDDEIDPDALKSVRLAEIGGTSVPDTLVAELSHMFGIHPFVSYGSTEAPATITRIPAGEPPSPGYVGLPLPQVRVTVRSSTGEELGTGEEGEIWVGPSQEGAMAQTYSPYLGYWKQPNLTKRSLRGGEFRTGDLGVLDETGRLYIRGRQSDLIIRGGANIHAGEVERVIAGITGVQGCAVLGLPDERLGERVVAVVEPKPGVQLNPDKVKQSCVGNLAKYKVPEEIRIVEALPRNAMQKIVKRSLVQLFEG
jgi:acyl-CoA synthetase (AMP-forming)/AMP-acid ligase II